MADRIKGVDVSDHQPDWHPTPDMHYVFIKATEGKSWKANKAVQHCRRARNTGYVVGFYHFLWPSATSGTPAQQANWFIDNAEAFGMRVGDLLVCDWEPTKGGTPTESDKDQFIAAVQRARSGKNRVGLYCNLSMWNGSNRNDGDFLWIARYGAEPIFDWQFWQYTEKPIDTNWADFPSRDALRRWATPSSSGSGSGSGSGIHGMSQPILIKWDADTSFTDADGWIDLPVNDKGHATVMGENPQVTADATVRIAGLVTDEWVEIAWRLVEIDSKGNTLVKTTRLPITIIGVSGRKQNDSTTFHGAVPKNQRLRVSARTNSKTAVIDQLQVQGWKQ